MNMSRNEKKKTCIRWKFVDGGKNNSMQREMNIIVLFLMEQKPCRTPYSHRYHNSVENYVLLFYFFYRHFAEFGNFYGQIWIGVTKGKKLGAQINFVFVSIKSR